VESVRLVVGCCCCHFADGCTLLLLAGRWCYYGNEPENRNRFW